MADLPVFPPLVGRTFSLGILGAHFLYCFSHAVFFEYFFSKSTSLIDLKIFDKNHLLLLYNIFLSS